MINTVPQTRLGIPLLSYLCDSNGCTKVHVCHNSYVIIVTVADRIMSQICDIGPLRVNGAWF